MTGSNSAAIDLIKELRLRTWARENHVPAMDHSPSWHPVVLDEMQRKDRDATAAVITPARPARRVEQPQLAEPTRSAQPMRHPRHSAYVPLPPTTVCLVHSGHVDYPEPNLLRTPDPVQNYVHISELM